MLAQYIYKWKRALSQEVKISSTLAFLSLSLAFVFACYLHYRALFEDRVNFPIDDDFYALLGTTIHFLNSTETAGFVKSLFEFNNEHLIFTTRIVSLAYYKLTGDINIFNLTLVGNFFSVLFLLLLIADYYKRNKSHWSQAGIFMLPLPFLVLNIYPSETYVLSMVSLSHLQTIFYASVTGFLLAQDGNRFVAPTILIAILTTISSANGLLVWPVGALLLMQKRNWVQFIFYALLGSAVIYIYFSISPHKQGTGSVVSGYTQLWAKLFAFLTLAGKFVVYQKLQLIAGGASILLFVYLFITGYYKKNLFYGFLQFFFLGSLGMIVFFRDPAFATNRSLYFVFGYLIFSIHLLSVIDFMMTLRLTDQIERASIKYALLFVFTFSCIVSYNGFQKGVLGCNELLSLIRHNQMLYHVYQPIDGQSLPNQLDPVLKYGRREILDSCISKGIYKPKVEDVASLQDFQNTPLSLGISTLLVGDLNSLEGLEVTTANYFMLSGWAVRQGVRSKDSNFKFLLSNENRTYLYPCHLSVRGDIAARMNDQSYMFAGVSALISKAEIKPGKYALAIYSKANSIIEVRFLRHIII